MSTMPAGTTVFFSGHAMMLAGASDGMEYVISATGSLVDTNASSTTKTYNVILNPLTTKRGNGKTWLTNMETIVSHAPAIELSKCDIALTVDKEPSVQVSFQDSPLYEGVNYDVTFTYDATKGIHKAELVGKNNFTGTAVKTFVETPKGTSLVKVGKGKKKMIVSWKKGDTQIEGYQIRYSTKASMKNAKNVTIKQKSTVKKTISKLKSKKKYYVQIRTYKTYEGKVYYSDWSGKKKVVIK